MSDLIDRQAAIDALKKEQAHYTPEDGAEIFYEYNHAIKALENLPSAQPEPQWIPCERELPAVGRSVLISVGGIYTAEGCLRDDGDWTQFRWDAIQRKDMVGAWKPLEEPYKGEQE